MRRPLLLTSRQVCVAVLLLCASALWSPVANLTAIAAQPPPGDRPTGTGVVRGVVVGSDSGQPLPRAEVRITLNTGGFTTSTTADTDGRFEFSGLPPGNLQLGGQHPGYSSPGLDRATPAVTVAVANGQVVTGVVLRLTRAGAIAGHVTDEFGQPLEGAQIEIFRWETTPRGRLLQQVGQMSSRDTDDRGAFRVWGLPPGEYLVSARPSRMFAARNPNPPAGDGYTATFYPGTTTAANAQGVRVRPGQDTNGVTFGLISTRVASIRGRVLVPEGTPRNRIMIMVTRLEAERMYGGGAGAGLMDDGTFTASRLAPGTYRLTATVRDDNGTGRAAYFGTTDVVVDGADVDGIVIPLRAGTTLRGRLVTDDGSPAPARDARVFLYPRQDSNAPPLIPPMARVDADGRFDVRGAFGRMLVSLSLGAAAAAGSSATESPSVSATTGGPSQPPRRWTVKAIYVDGQDVADSLLDFDRGDIDAEILLTSRIAEVRGTVTWSPRDDGARPRVYVFSADPDHWIQPTRRMREMVVGEDGRFRIAAVPPGDRYLAVAVEGTPTRVSWTPELLKALSSSATALRVDEGGVYEVTLRAVSRPAIEP
jgi:hypothetical protein